PCATTARSLPMARPRKYREIARCWRPILATDGALLAVDGLVAGYGQIRILRGVDLVVRRGEVVALLGANGSGKSTALNTISGFIRPMAGRIRLDGQDIGERPLRRTFKTGVAEAY